ncbi:MAG: anthranilate synthase component I family protein [Desulfobacteraceae bacterium]
MILKTYPEKNEFTKLAETANVVPVCTDILADTETPVSLLQKFYRPDRPVFLLESVEGQERWARYSFLGVHAHSVIRIYAQNIEISSPSETRMLDHNGDPLGIIRKLLSGYIPAQVSGLPRFWSGLTGYFTYEMVSFFEKIPVHLPENKAYASFIIPEQMMIFDNMKHTLTCMKICYLNRDDNPAKAYESALSEIKEMIRLIETPFQETETSRHEKSAIKPEIPGTEYIRGVESIKQRIVDGDIIQAVYSQPFSCICPADPVMVYRAQRYINPSPYMFFMNFGDIAIAGSSPETMVRLENRTATLRPIAGTRPRGATEQEDRLMADELLNDEKEKAEHVMLVDLGRNDLGRVAQAGSVQVTDTMFIERYSHVMHLVSNIVCDMKPELDAFDLLKASFPAGTLSGAPKIKAMEILASLEPSPRGVYGGAAGYISFSGNMDLAIIIRTAVMAEDRLTVQAGAGIVYDSDPEKELMECINKAKSVEAALKLAAGNHGGTSC